MAVAAWLGNLLWSCIRNDWSRSCTQCNLVYWISCTRVLFNFYVSPTLNTRKKVELLPTILSLNRAFQCRNSRDYVTRLSVLKEGSRVDVVLSAAGKRYQCSTCRVVDWVIHSVIHCGHTNTWHSKLKLSVHNTSYEFSGKLLVWIL